MLLNTATAPHRIAATSNHFTTDAWPFVRDNLLPRQMPPPCSESVADRNALQVPPLTRRDRHRSHNQPSHRARYLEPSSASREIQSTTIRADQAKSSRKFEKSS